MKTTRLMAVAVIAVSALALHSASAQQGIKRTDLQRHDLSVPGREVIQVRVDIGPGATFPKHTHPGEEIIYVLEGSLEYQVEGKPPVTLKVGDWWDWYGSYLSARQYGSMPEQAAAAADRYMDEVFHIPSR